MWAFTCPLSHLKAQDTLSYKSWASFKGDTVAYLEYNFQTRGKQYVGKKVSDVFKDLELPVIETTEAAMGQTRKNEQGNKGGELVRLSLCILKTGKEPVFHDYYITFAFKNPPVIPFGTSREWSPQMYERIKDLEVSALGTVMYREYHSKYLEYKKKEEKK
jgi:hypothetical protein